MFEQVWATKILLVFSFNLYVGHAIAQVAVPAGPVSSMTPHIGLQFRQDGKILPIRDISAGESLVEIRRKAFEVLLRAETWRTPTDEYPALMVTVSDDPVLFQVARLEEKSNELAFFQPGYGMADVENGSGSLLAIDVRDKPFGFNYVSGSRYNITEPKNRGFYVATIPYQEKDLIHTGANIYLVFHLDPTDTAETDHSSLDPARVDPLNVDAVKIHFID